MLQRLASSLTVYQHLSDRTVMQNLELHPLDAQVLRGEPFINPCPTFYKAQCNTCQCKLAVDVEVYLNYIALDLVNHLGLKLEPHPRPHYLDDEYVEYQCKISFKIGQYEDEILCDVVDIKRTSILLGRSWIRKKHVPYVKKWTMYVFP